MSNLSEILVVAGLFFSKNTILAVKRPQNKSSGGLWEFPGGKIEKRETPEQALKRELQEELDVEVRVLSLLGKSEVAVEGKIISMSLFEVQVIEGVIKLLEHDALCWISEDLIDDLAWAPADIPLLSRVKTILQTRS